MDCIFCQLGRTTNKTIERLEHAPTDKVIKELQHWQKNDGSADFISLAGSGEPTLHSRFGEVINFARANCDAPVALLTNGAMFALPEVRDAAMSADVVKISLCAWNQSIFEHIHRPHPQLVFERTVEGLGAFRRQFSGKLWLEVFLIWGVNASVSEVEKIAALANYVRPDKIQLNTAVRPPAEDYVAALPGERMESLKKLFSPAAEIIADFNSAGMTAVKANETTILSMLRRRPCEASQIAEVFGMHLNEVAKHTGKLMSEGKIRAERSGAAVYYIAAEKDFPSDSDS